MSEKEIWDKVLDIAQEKFHIPAIIRLSKIRNSTHLK